MTAVSCFEDIEMEFSAVSNGEEDSTGQDETMRSAENRGGYAMSTLTPIALHLASNDGANEQ